MVSTVTLIVTRGPLAGQKFDFDEATDCTIGRSRDCTIALPLEAEHLDVSRHHCLIRIEPPEANVRDLGSLNGTYVNGKKIGQRGRNNDITEVDCIESPVVPVTEGDEIRLGEHTAFRVCVTDPTREEKPLRKRRHSSGELRFPEPVPH